MSHAHPPQEAIDAIISRVTHVTRRVEIFESDGITPWIPEGATSNSFRPISGSVNVSLSRPERRTVDLTLANLDNKLAPYPEGFWYDKVLTVWRGVRYGENLENHYEVSLGQFLIDRIEEPSFPREISISGRDYTKRLLLSKFATTITFTAATPVEEVIRTIAVNGGITKFLTLNRPDIVLGRDFTFERATSRWEAIYDIASSFGLEVFFDQDGFLVLREHLDPVTSPVHFSFKSGENGTIARFTKVTNDNQIYNQVLVVGASSDNAVEPVWHLAENLEPSSPTRIRLRIPGDTGGLEPRLYEYKSALVTTEEQAEALAHTLLKVYALEEFNIDLQTVVLLWLEAGNIIQFIDPTPNPGDPTRYLLTDFTIPLALGSMSITAKRVTIVGDGTW